MQRGHPGKWQTKTEEKNLSAKVIIREFKNYFLTIQTAFAECHSLLDEVTRWTNTMEQRIKCQMMHETEMNSLYISYFQTMVEAVYLRIWPRISGGWKNTSHTVTNNSTYEMIPLSKFPKPCCTDIWKPIPCFSDNYDDVDDDNSNSIISK